MPTRRIKYRSVRKRKPLPRKARYIILIAFLFLIFLFIQGDQGFMKYLKLQREKKQLQQLIKELQAEQDSLVTEIDMLTNDYRYIEKIAREQYHLGKKGEKIFIMKSPPK
jgi:cell division protein FtsB